MLLSINDAAWKITDFGLTSEGTSRYAYSTRYGRGTESYRAPELVRETSIVTKKSDIWALGCILYELTFKTKAFPRDINVFEYAHRERRLEIHNLPTSERVNAYLRELVYRTLEIDWWKRPNSGDILKLLNSLSDKSLSDWVFSIDDSEMSPESEETSPELTESTSSAERPNSAATNLHGLKPYSEAIDNIIGGGANNSPWW